MKNSKNKSIRFFGEIRLKNGKYKVAFMQKLVGVNQYRRRWANVDTTQFAKQLNSHLIHD